MAVDQALFEQTLGSGVASARFYGWSEPATTVGYFHQFQTGSSLPPYPVRRYTGGGLVEHGEDLTFVITLPRDSAPAHLTGEERYRWIHEALAGALVEAEVPVVLESAPSPSATGPCFTNAVTWDLLSTKTGKKIGGGAQRRSSGAVIHQGSVRLPESLRDPEADWIDSFLSLLATRSEPLSEKKVEALRAPTMEFLTHRFSTESWNRWAS